MNFTFAANNDDDDDDKADDDHRSSTNGPRDIKIDLNCSFDDDIATATLSSNDWHFLRHFSLIAFFYVKWSLTEKPFSCHLSLLSDEKTNHKNRRTKQEPLSKEAGQRKCRSTLTSTFFNVKHLVLDLANHHFPSETAKAIYDFSTINGALDMIPLLYLCMLQLGKVHAHLSLAAY